MRKLKTWLAIDALTICYTAKNSGVIRQLFNMGSGKKDFGDFYLFCRKDKKQYKRDCVYDICYNNKKVSDLHSCKIGTLSFNRKPHEYTKEFYFFIKLSNKALYNGDFWCISYVSQHIGLTFHNFTKIEIDLDTEYNPLRLYEDFKSMGRLPKAKAGETPKKLLVKTIYNGKAVDWNSEKEIVKRQIKGLYYYHLADSHALNEKTLYVEPTKGEAFMKIYNKSNEVEWHSGKDYILEKYGNPSQLYRIELTVFSEEIKEYIKLYKAIQLNPLAIFQKRHILRLFKLYAHRLLRWNVGGVVVDFTDIYKPQKTTFLAL